MMHHICYLYWFSRIQYRIVWLNQKEATFSTLKLLTLSNFIAHEYIWNHKEAIL